MKTSTLLVVLVILRSLCIAEEEPNKFGLIATAIVLPGGAGFAYQKQPAQAILMMIAETAIINWVINAWYDHRAEKMERMNALIVLGILKIADADFMVTVVNQQGPTGIVLPQRLQIGVQIPLR